ncbi:hypothetical protein Q5Y75_23790 [Ruegeria sp. 2205SS24-7]|uniref:hypothetical protein n=1 Tax=Ruegeria discodermiae TaxID=3064389 RepID=UPI002740F8CC|nr:hypothetical protein [Ruegeria sp. 2205SS24-7]MDP5220218.1 hypothetical protein [Ruegeria sp. 2205SS24-7]
MTIETINIGDPFFAIRIITDEAVHKIADKTIALNLGAHPIRIRQQSLGPLQSAIVQNTELERIEHAVLINGFARHRDEVALMSRIRATWPTAFEVRAEERLRGIEHYMSPKVWVGQVGLTLYHAASVPLNVGLHRDHPFCPVPGFREVHTQIMGIGKMQQCRERDIATLYLEEPMAPGSTHRPMYDEHGNFPWHQFETITPSVFMAVEMLPDGVTPPQ